ncbi:alpha/beta hydrolase [Pseudomonas schmalbachii]|uniref:Dienelactone hydrolase family protein n=1 Tax=Pseudomonas schmalbachii TaxID=2816993 RepID=A0ABS3TTM3_9PSED|nr:dienelactone hydrolase family protein [Pseudomonas schmalbachii]MBO3277017.1 dienelactone hydrolase family protein [Pseudomonas schmalbachii]
MALPNPHLEPPIRVFGAAPRDARLAVILVHGRGQSAELMRELVVERFGRADLAWFAPTADGGSWYPERFIAPLEVNEPRLSQALERIGILSAELVEQGFPHSSQVLMGFSQGGCLCCEFAWRSPNRYRALVAFTGGLIGPPGMPRDTARPALRDLPVLLSSWDDDPYVPPESVQESAALFRSAGAEVHLHIEPAVEHGIRDAEIGYARDLLDAEPLHQEHRS